MRIILTVLLFVSLFLSGCASLPRDARRWTERIRQTHVLPVGVSRDVEGPLTAVADREKELVEAVAARFDARVEWRPGNAHQLLRDMEEGKLPLVAAQVTTDSPFGKTVGLSRPYLSDGPEKRAYCLAVAPGENQLLLMVDQTVEANKRAPREAVRP